jgi:hypothetical protein
MLWVVVIIQICIPLHKSYWLNKESLIAHIYLMSRIKIYMLLNTIYFMLT